MRLFNCKTNLLKRELPNNEFVDTTGTETNTNTQGDKYVVKVDNQFSTPHKKEPFWIRAQKVIKYLGPAWLVAMAYLDPGNLEGDLAAGALRDPSDPHRGFRLLWILLWATVIGFSLQRLCIKLAVATGKDLAALTYAVFPRWLCIVIWIITELCLIGIDAQAVIGSAIAFQLLFKLPLEIGVLVTLLQTFIFLLITVWGTQKLEIFFSLMIALMGCCFLLNMFIAKPEIAPIIHGLVVPIIPKNTIAFAIGIIGCVIMPHNFFLQTSVVQSRYVDRSDPKHVKNATKIYVYETFAALFVSLIISISVVCAFANVNVPEGEDLSLSNAHTSLEGSFGTLSGIVWSLGLLSAGTCSTMAGAYCGQFVLEGLLNVRIRRLWLRMLVTRLISIVPVLFIIFMKTQTVETLSTGVNIMQALYMPFLVTIFIKFSSSEELMTKDHCLSKTSKLFGYICGILLMVANIAYLIIETAGITYYIIVPIALYICAIIYLWWKPLNYDKLKLRKESTSASIGIVEAPTKEIT